MAAAMRARARRRAAARRSPASRSTAARIKPGEAFFAIKGDKRDGHDFVEAALKAGAGARGRRRATSARCSPTDAPLLVVDDVLEALDAISAARRARARTAQDHRRHRLGRQDRHQGGAAPRAVGATARRMPRPRPTTITGACRCRWRAARRRAHYAVFEIGMNHAGEIAPLVEAGAAACGDHHHGRAGASGILRLGSRRSPTPRRKSSQASSRAARRVINRDNPQFARLQQPRAKARASRASSRSASMPKADARLLDVALQPDCSAVQADILGARRHLQARRARPPSSSMNSLAVLAAASLAGADLALAALALSQICSRRSGAARA